MQETGALLAGEMSGHIFFKERWYGFDDGLYAGARLLEILSKVNDPSATLNALPDAYCTPELHVHIPDGEPHRLMERLKTSAHFTDALEIITLDGLRVEYADGFGLARASNTTPMIVLRFEAETEAGLRRIQNDFRRVLHEADATLNLPI
jgi:phosphomannomutase/phosphoglucomutase